MLSWRNANPISLASHACPDALNDRGQFRCVLEQGAEVLGQSASQGGSRSFAFGSPNAASSQGFAKVEFSHSSPSVFIDKFYRGWHSPASIKLINKK